MNAINHPRLAPLRLFSFIPITSGESRIRTGYLTGYVTLHNFEKILKTSGYNITSNPGTPANFTSAAANLAEKRHGLRPGTEQYHRFIDEYAGVPEADEKPQPVRQSRKQGGASRRPIAAPGSRFSGRSPQSQVHLSEFDQKTARELGISLQDYSRKYKSKAQEGQYDRSVTGGRLHASYHVNQYEDHY